MIPVSSPTAAEGALEELGRELEKATGGDPLAPVTVATPSAYCAVYVRRVLAAGPGAGGRRGWANVSCTTVPALVDRLAGPSLAARGLVEAPAAVDLEVIRSRARTAGGWLEAFSSHPAAVVELRRALVALRRCPPPSLETIGRAPGRAKDLVELVVAVRGHLHDGGFADSGDVAAEALAAARLGPSVVETIGPLLTWRLGPMGPSEDEILHVLGSREVDGTASTLPASLTTVRACTDPDEEARSAARSVVAGAESGLPLWQQAVFHPPGPTYARILRQHLDGAGAAHHGPEPDRLARSLTGRALLALLDLADGDWPRHEVLDWLSSAPVTVRPGGPPVPATRWDLLSAEAGVVRGRQQWHERLGRAAVRGGPEAEESATLAAFIDELLVRAAPPRGSWQAFGTWALDLLDHYLLPGTGPDRWPDHEEADARHIRTVIASLSELDRVSGGADLPSFRRVLRTELGTAADTGECDAGDFGDGVLVAPYAAARGLQFHSVVVTGLADTLASGGDSSGLLGPGLSAPGPVGDGPADIPPPSGIGASRALVGRGGRLPGKDRYPAARRRPERTFPRPVALAPPPDRRRHPEPSGRLLRRRPGPRPARSLGP